MPQLTCIHCTLERSPISNLQTITKAGPMTLRCAITVLPPQHDGVGAVWEHRVVEIWKCTGQVGCRARKT